MNRVLLGLVSHPWATLGMLLLVSLGAVAGIVEPTTGELRLRIDPSTDNLIAKQSKAFEFYQEARVLFGNDQPVVLALSGPELLSPDGLARVKRLTRRLERLPFVKRVVSLSTALNVRAVDGEVEVAPFLEEIPETPQQVAALRDRIDANPLAAGTLLSRDGETTALVVHLADLDDEELFARSSVL